MTYRKPPLPARFFYNTAVFSLLILILYSPDIYAERATDIEMENICRNWLKTSTYRGGSWFGVIDPQISGTEDIFEDGQLLGRIYAISPAGFVAVPKLKELPPIMAYSEKYNLDDNQIYGMQALITEFLNNRTNVYALKYGSPEAVLDTGERTSIDFRYRELWERYSVSEETFISVLKSGDITRRWEQGGPLLTTAWHQGYPYNIYCPTGYGDNHCVVGCVATAAAQIIYYWQWPMQGTGNRSYFWGGDNSCDTSTGGQTLYADFSDPYIYDTAPENLAELNYEVGVAFNMDYGVCGSGTYVEIALNVFPTYFKYLPAINQRNRAGYENAEEWYNVIKNEVEAGRPMQYRISRHSIVCDGYQESGGILFYHMNYGWGGSMNAWFAIDDLYCSWDGCDYMTEFMIRGIEPFWVWPTADITFGVAPLEVNFTAETDFDVDSWNWDFGDGYAIDGDYPTAQHTYEAPGIFDITVGINTEGENHSIIRPEYIIVLADTLTAGNAEGEIGDPVEITISAGNTIPIDKITIPLKYSGAMGLRYDSCSTSGCRTDGFILDETSLGSGFMLFKLLGNACELGSGSGPILKTYFTIISGSESETATIALNNIGSNYPAFESATSGLQYQPATLSGSVCFPGICGDTDNDDTINILDIVYLINYIYKSGPPPVPLNTADVDSDEAINILDIVYLINHLYKLGPEPVCL